MIFEILFTFYIVAFTISIIYRRIYIVSECFGYKIVNPLTSPSPHAIFLDTKGLYINVCILAPIIEEFIFRFLPCLIYFYTGNIVPIIILNIAWIIGHYFTIKTSIESLTFKEWLSAFLGYSLWAVLYTCLTILLMRYSLVLAYLIPVTLHAISNAIAITIELKKSNVKSINYVYYGKYWELSE